VSARARVVEGGDSAERAEVWKKMVAIYPPFDAYQERAEREIPVVVFEAID